MCFVADVGEPVVLVSYAAQQDVSAGLHIEILSWHEVVVKRRTTESGQSDSCAMLGSGSRMMV